MGDAFDVLGVEPSFTLDLAALEGRHRELSRALHPDRHSGKPAGERRLALSKAIEVNEAWRVLRDPVRRAEALLTRWGIPVGETREPAPEPELLMEMMERREELAEARARREATAVHALARAMLERDVAVQQALAAALAALGGGITAAATANALARLGELRYVRRYLEEVGEILDVIE